MLTSKHYFRVASDWFALYSSSYSFFFLSFVSFPVPVHKRMDG